MIKDLREKSWKRVDEELKYVATYASPEQRMRLLAFLRGQFNTLLSSEISATKREERERITGIIEKVRYEGNKWLITDREWIWNAALDAMITKIKEIK